ncbi:phosphate transporter PHO1-like [Vicia villosa]|uniref:phosphate transporter PHO1-like n=1 Tax=Vicia villosa TaxID=3911 RepID=UPI00273C9372|nr:phosphate transporter PHO1-like [Vicia villosa]
MVKFAKALDAQMLPEWKEDFMNYRQLKKLIKIMKLSMTSNLNQNDERTNENSIFNSVSSIVKKVTSGLSSTNNIIKLRMKTTVENGEEIYKTELVQLFSQDDKVFEFFVRLDDELNKVNHFFIKKESDFLERGDTLNKLLQILLDLKQIINDHGQLTNIVQKVPPPTQDSNLLEFIAITNLLWKDLVNNSTGDFLHKKMVHIAQKVLRSAFAELYQSLDSLKTYSSLNMVAFLKILTKFDKVSSQKVSASYFKVVQRSHFVSSDKVVRLMDEVESIFTKQFVNDDKKKTMKFLKPKQHKDLDMINFFVGLSTGCFLSLLCVYASLAHFYDIFSPINELIYMKIMYPIFSVFALLSLHLFMYGCNLYMWKRSRINYSLIFDFSPRTSLKYRDAFFTCTTLMTIVFGAMVIQLLLSASEFSSSHIDVFSGILFVVFIALLFFPFDIFYRPTRYFFIRVICKIVCSPFFKVMLIDMFMVDQLTSQIPLLRHLETTSYNFFIKVFKIHHHDTRHSRTLYMEITSFILFFPYYWGALQCIRQWFDDGDVNNLANMGKYVSAIVAMGARITYNIQNNHICFAIVLITSFVTTSYHIYWDTVKDWNLLNPHSRNPWLRDHLVLKNKKIYFVSMAINIILRMTWVLTIIPLQAGAAKMRVGPTKVGLIDFLLASLEIIRRGHWNFYRIENEYIRNIAHHCR